MTEIEALFDGRPKNMDFLAKEEKKGMNSILVKAALYGFAGFGVLSAAYLVTSFVVPDALAVDPVQFMSLKEKLPLHKMQQYCFNRIGVLNDPQTCKIWADKYVSTVSGVQVEEDDVQKAEKEETTAYLDEKHIPQKPDKHKMWEQEAEAATVPGKL